MGRRPAVLGVWSGPSLWGSSSCFLNPRSSWSRTEATGTPPCPGGHPLPGALRAATVQVSARPVPLYLGCPRPCSPGAVSPAARVCTFWGPRTPAPRRLIAVGAVTLGPQFRTGIRGRGVRSRRPHALRTAPTPQSSPGPGAGPWHLAAKCSPPAGQAPSWPLGGPAGELPRRAGTVAVVSESAGGRSGPRAGGARSGVRGVTAHRCSRVLAPVCVGLSGRPVPAGRLCPDQPSAWAPCGRALVGSGRPCWAVASRSQALPQLFPGRDRTTAGRATWAALGAGSQGRGQTTPHA